MAKHADALDLEALEDIARQVADRQARRRRLGSGGGGEPREFSSHLGESFSVWTLDLPSTTLASHRLRSVARPTGRWHHQIHHERKAVQFARSKAVDDRGNAQQVVELVESDLAPAIDEAIEWLDGNVETMANAQLLHVPAYLMTVFWFESNDEDKIFVVHAPAAYLRPFGHQRYLPAETFLRNLSRLPHVRGASAPAQLADREVRGVAATGRTRRQPELRSAIALACVLGLVVLGFIAPALGWPRPLAFIASLVLLAGVFVGIGLGLGRGWAGVIIDSRNCMSLSKLQACAWTILVFSALMVGASFNFHDSPAQALAITVPNPLLEALGIAGVSLAAAPALLSLKTQQRPSPGAIRSAALQKLRQGGAGTATNIGALYTNTSVADADWTDMITGDEVGNAATADLGKIQQLLVTIFLVLAYGMIVYHSFGGSGKYTTLPKFDESLVWLMAVSHGSYLAYKAAPHTTAAGHDNQVLPFN